MNKKIFLLFLIFCTLIISTIFTGCITSKQSIIYDGRIRTYLLHIPSIYNDSQSFPLVIALHGGGGNSRSMMKKTGFKIIGFKTWGSMTAGKAGKMIKGFFDKFVKKTGLGDVVSYLAMKE